MAKRQYSKKKIIEPPEQESSPESLIKYISEAEHVGAMTRTPGWSILSTELLRYQKEIGEKLAYLDPKTPIFNESRIVYLAVDKLLKMVDDYEENKKQAITLLDKLHSVDTNIVLDVDNG